LVVVDPAAGAPALGTLVPAAGAGGLSVFTGWAGDTAAGDPAAGAGAAGAPGRAGGLGMYSGPVWPQAESSASMVSAESSVGNANGDFTIRITV
jgi:hypothetical protein